jgi:hypothetical protein
MKVDVQGMAAPDKHRRTWGTPCIDRACHITGDRTFNAVIKKYETRNTNSVFALG